MSNDLSLPPVEDLDSLMLKVARNVAQDIYTIEDILKNCGVSGDDYAFFLKHPRFQGYLISEREAWLSAGNIESRTKLKAGIVLETYMDGAYHEMTDNKTPLNQRVELGKMLAKIAGFGEPKSFVNTGGGGGGGGFMLQINIGPGKTEPRQTITIEPEVVNLPPDIRWDSTLSDDLEANEVAIIKKIMSPPDEDEDYDPLVSPRTLDDEEEA